MAANNGVQDIGDSAAPQDFCASGGRVAAHFFPANPLGGLFFCNTPFMFTPCWRGIRQRIQNVSCFRPSQGTTLNEVR